MFTTEVFIDSSGCCLAVDITLLKEGNISKLYLSMSFETETELEPKKVVCEEKLWFIQHALFLKLLGTSLTLYIFVKLYDLQGSGKRQRSYLGIPLTS